MTYGWNDFGQREGKIFLKRGDFYEWRLNNHTFYIYFLVLPQKSSKKV